MKNKYNFAALLALALTAASAFKHARARPGAARQHLGTTATLITSTDSPMSGTTTSASVNTPTSFDDFKVTDPTGWHLTSLYSNNNN